MPIYEYECGKCGVFETSQRISEPALTKCPTCRRKVRRLISSTSFQLKGSGWYVTDYARSGSDKKGAKDGESKAESKSESSSDSSTPEAKPKPESKSKKTDTKADTKSGGSTSATTAS